MIPLTPDRALLDVLDFLPEGDSPAPFISLKEDESPFSAPTIDADEPTPQKGGKEVRRKAVPNEAKKMSPRVGENKPVIRSIFEIAADEKEIPKECPIAPLSPLLAPVRSEAPRVKEVSGISKASFPLFEEMSNTLVHMQTHGITETHIFLDTPQYSSSPFYQARITIREYSTSPKIFNIEFSGHAFATQKFQEQIPALMTFFGAQDFSFGVHRIEISLTPEEKPLVHRKENVSGEETT